MSNVILSKVRKSFGSLEIIKGVDLEIEQGEFAVFVGPSGCGKSTLLRLISGLEDLSSGSIKIGEQDVTFTAPSKRGISMVFQSYALFPHMSVAENMSFGLRLKKTPKNEIEKKVLNAAEILQITHLLDRIPRQLSGGQRQRVAIGRSIVRNPSVFLFDEPLSNLDAALRVNMRVEIARLHKEIGTTMIYVTHDQVEAMTLADKIVVLNDGKIEQVGNPMDLYRQPGNLFVAGFIGSPKMNFFKTSLEKEKNRYHVTLDTMKIDLNLNEQVADKKTVTLGIRPEDIRICDADQDNSCRAQVVVVERLGGETLVYIKIPGLPDLFTIKVPHEVNIISGETLFFSVDPATCHLFDKDGTAIR